jgi:hypothetical protein
MRQMLRDHLKLTTNEAVARFHGDWAGDITAYDAVHQQILQMADGLTMGLVTQFPEKFKQELSYLKGETIMSSSETY